MRRTRKLFRPPAGASPTYYRDLLMSLIAVAGVMAALAGIIQARWPLILGGFATAAFGVVLAGNRIVPVTSVLLLTALRSGIAFALTGDPRFAIGAIAFAALGIWLFRRFGGDPGA